mgnify:CR=1 FL=1
MNKNYGLTRDTISAISEQKKEPEWMREFRLKSLDIFFQKPLPSWGADLSKLSFDDICYYLKPAVQHQKTWDSVPADIRTTFDKLGIPQAEQKLLAGVGAQYESEVIYKKLKQEWKDLGVIFLDTDTALTQYPDLFKKYFATIVPPTDNKFAALNAAAWSGGSFVYIPAGVRVELPLQAYFRINEPRMGQFERTLIIAEPNSFVHYVEGCSAPIYRSASLHSAVVEIVCHEKSHVRYTTIQNWSSNVYNLVTKRAIAHAHARMEWVDGNFGSGVTMKYPSIILAGQYSTGQVISVAIAKNNQIQDTGAKIIHRAPHTRSHVIAKSISSGTGISTYRGLLSVTAHAQYSHAHVQCDALLLDTQAQSNTYPTITNRTDTAHVGHEASISTLCPRQIEYLGSRGISPTLARALITTGFIEPFITLLPMEYAVEINRLIALEMDGSVG